MLNWPLMENNITREDRLAASNFFLAGDDAGLSSNILTQGPQIAAFEEEFSKWLGVQHSVFVNSGSSANIATIAALKALYGPGEIIVPCITWVSDIAAVLHAGMTPVFVDIDPDTLGMDANAVARALTSRTRAVFLTHCLGFNALNAQLRDMLDERGIPLIEDCCESIGATWNGSKVGKFGLASNFSFYYAHHMSTIEGGMICTDDYALYQILRRLRAHGLVREMSAPIGRDAIAAAHPDLSPQFIFQDIGWNFRSSEVNAVIGRSQLKRLDANNELRSSNLRRWLGGLDSIKYHTTFKLEGSSNYALPLVLRDPSPTFMRSVRGLLDELRVEYRMGTAGGGNQLRQPYARRLIKQNPEAFPNAELVHFNGLYIGNFPVLEAEKIDYLTARLSLLGMGYGEPVMRSVV